MPQIKIKGAELNHILFISKPMVDELQALLQVPREYFTIEYVEAVYIKDGSRDSGFPMIEVSWFDRGQELQDKTASIITRYVQTESYKNVDVYFIPLLKNNYYENGTHF